MGVSGKVAWVGALALLFVAAGPRARAAGAIHTVTTAADSADSPPDGSLRKILESAAQPGDSIVFAQNFSIRVDPKFRLRVPAGLTGITITGPAEIRGGVLEVIGDGCTVTGVRFADCRVFGGAGSNYDDDSRTDDFRFLGNQVVGDAGLVLVLAANALIAGNEFDVRAPRGANAVSDFAGEHNHWSGNTWTATSLGGFSEANGTDLSFDGGNSVHGDAWFFPRSGRIAGNVVKGHLRAYRADLAMDGPLVIEGNTCGTLGARRPDIEVRGNTVTGRPLAKAAKVAKLVRNPDGRIVPVYEKEPRVAAASVGNALAAGDGGYVEFEDNVIDATDGWVTGALVGATADATGLLVRGNEVTGGKLAGLVVNPAGPATVEGNTVVSGGKKGALQVNGAGAGGVVLQENVVTGGTGVGILVGAGEGTATLLRNTVSGCRGVGLQASGRTVVSVDGRYGTCGIGVVIGKFAKATLTGGSISGNRGAGLLCDPFSTVEVARVSFGGNGGVGIDLAPGGVSINAKKKTANGNMPYPETLEYDASTGKAKGVAEPLARIDAYAVETGPRAGNPKNGEGAEWLGEVVAGADGRFVFPASGRLACPASGRLTFTATRQGAGIDPVTSEFSLDVDCSGPPFLMIDRAPDGTPGDQASVAGAPVLAERYRTISDDGRFVVFTSAATNLVEGDTNGVIDVFLRDTVLGTTTRVNRTPAGGQVEFVGTDPGDAGSAPSISADGRWICYTSRAEGSFTDGTWYFNDAGVILYDTLTGSSTVVASPLEQPGPLPSGSYSYGGAYYASVSGDGSAVIFSARSPDYAPGDVGDDNDAFVWTRATGAIERVSVPTGGGDPTNGWQAGTLTGPRLSYDGRFAVFCSAHNLSGGTLPYSPRIWVRDRQAGTTDAACIDSTGSIRSGYDPWVSDDGRFVVFWSTESLVPADANGFADVYLRDRQAGTTTLVSAKDDGTAMYGDSLEPCISGDGRFVSFRNFGDVWLVDRQEGTRTNVSGSPTVYPNVGCSTPRISRTGRFLQFETPATNLVDLGGQSFVTHVYLRDLSAPAK